MRDANLSLACLCLAAIALVASSASSNATSPEATPQPPAHNVSAAAPSKAPAPSETSSQQAAAPLPAEQAQQAQRQAIRTRVAAQLDNVINFWKAHGPDRQFGAFHGTLNQQGQPVASPERGFDKGLVQTARHLWSFSLLYALRERTPEIEALCNNLYSFLVAHFRDPRDNLYYQTVSQDGSRVTKDVKPLYAEVFLLQALARYAQVFSNQSALDAALRTFRTLDSLYHRDGLPGWSEMLGKVGVDPGALGYNRFDTQLHVMEALADVYQASKDPTVGARLAEIVDLFPNRLVDQQKGYVPRVFTEQWQPVSSINNDVLVGLNLELSWILVNSAAAINKSGDPAVKRAAQRASYLATAGGFDPTNGGAYYTTDLGGKVTSPTKVWWPQNEALLGLWRLHKLDPKDDTLLLQMLKTLDWMQTRQLDSQYGEFFWGLEPNGQLEAHGSDKGNTYKATYHSLGHMLQLEKMLAEDS
ncbi:hypothetical protein WJX72_009872 [[Myrmecia] bisecta]|uniref:N-acylglucosamine 2-epimerase n=1 Tax=[Myrmecia] bisecta TaxID=41462 RepID=A0AAW1PMA2_9CHLO